MVEDLNLACLFWMGNLKILEKYNLTSNKYIFKPTTYIGNQEEVFNSYIQKQTR